MTFEPGTYYIGDPGYVLSSDDLRMLFSELLRGGLRSGPRILIGKDQSANVLYWCAAMPHLEGTLYDQNNKGWGFDWGCFGVVPWEWIENQPSYETHKVEFTEPFQCSFTENSITIGHLHFTFNPK